MQVERILPFLICAGLMVTFLEWDNLVKIKKESPYKFYSRLFVLNLPIVLAINLMLLGEI